MATDKLWGRRVVGVLLLGLGALALAQSAPVDAGATVARVLERNAEARGGLDAWRRVQAMVWVGHVDVANRPDRNLPFMLEQKRPGSSRFEIISGGQKSVRVYNGKDGWKARSNGLSKPELVAFTDEELRFAHDAPVIQGPLMDFVAKGFKVRLVGDDVQEGHKQLVLSAALPNGVVHRVWLDAETFLESRLDREFRKANGQMAQTTVRYFDYHDFEGLQMPVTIETGAEPGAGLGSRLVIEKVALNPDLGDEVFDRPGQQIGLRRGRVTVDTRSAASQGSSFPSLRQ
jgi:hypothetical protein